MTTGGPDTLPESPDGRQAAPTPPSPPRRWLAAAAFLAGVVTFVPLQVLAQLATLFTVTEEGTPVARILITESIVILGPAAWLWRKRRGAWRWLSAGIATGFAVSLLAVLVEPLLNLPTHQAEQRLRTMATNSDTSLYYLGPKFNGWELDDVGIAHGGREDVTDLTLDLGDQADLLYGTTCSAFTVGTCGWQFEVSLHKITNGDLRRACRLQLPTIRGVPVLRSEDGDVLVFTDHVALSVRDHPSDDLVRRVVLALRPIGRSTPTTSDLPAPTRYISRATAQKCP